MRIDEARFTNAIRELIKSLGVNPDEEPYKRTEYRVLGVYRELFGDHHSKTEIRTFPSQYKGPVQIIDHIAWSLCPHHLLPVRLQVTLQYTPKESRVLGLSKLPRLLDKLISKGPILQEELTQDIIEGFKPYSKAIEIQIDGTHLCLVMRGVKSHSPCVRTYLKWEEKSEIPI